MRSICWRAFISASEITKSRAALLTMWVRIGGFRQRNATVPKLDDITDAERRGGYAVFLCHFHNGRVFERFTVGNRGVGFH